MTIECSRLPIVFGLCPNAIPSISIGRPEEPLTLIFLAASLLFCRLSPSRPSEFCDGDQEHPHDATTNFG